MSQIVLLLIVANVLVSVKGFGDNLFFNKFKFQIEKIQMGEKLRMVTSGFLHADWMHLGFNMYALFLFGRLLGLRFSGLYIFLIYILSLFAGSVYSLQKHK